MGTLNIHKQNVKMQVIGEVLQIYKINYNDKFI